MIKRQIMVVEDEEIVAMSLEYSLQALGYDIIGVVSSGEKAVEQAVRTHPDLIIMDIRLAGPMDGIEAAEQIRDCLDVPIIYLTAYVDEDTLARAKVSEPFGYIIKPFEDRDLHVAIEIGLYKHQMERERKRLLDELQAALDRIKVLKGLIPICASCKKIRDDEGYWNEVEAYLLKHADAKFSHGICPDCFQKLYPEFSHDK